MKRVLDDAGIRTPRHASACNDNECREAAERIGYPLILKPIAGAGSADTHRIDNAADLDRVGAVSFHRHLVKIDLDTEYDRELAWWLELLSSHDLYSD